MLTMLLIKLYIYKYKSTFLHGYKVNFIIKLNTSIKDYKFIQIY
jgi:hypothetical protein